MNHWVDFIMGNKPPPGPISNYQLFDELSIKSDAQRKCEDRCIVFVFVSSFFFSKSLFAMGLAIFFVLVWFVFFFLLLALS